MCTYPQKHKCIYPKCIVNSEKDCKRLLISSSYSQHLLFLFFFFLVVVKLLMVVETNAGSVNVTKSESHVMYCDAWIAYRGEREKGEHHRSKHASVTISYTRVPVDGEVTLSVSILPLAPPFCTENYIFKLAKLENLL